MAVAGRQAPVASGHELARALAAAGAEGRPVRFVGGGTKLAWGGVSARDALELSTAGLDRIVEHNAGDLTAMLQAGVPLERAQEAFAARGQMLALDPPAAGATVGGVLATGDSGPLRARFGGPRDLVVGMTVALGDGSLAKSGGKVIKNVAGYDLAKLFTSSFGALGAIVQVAVRLHPRPERTVTAACGSGDRDALAQLASALSHAPLEPLSLDVRWGGGDGAVLARFGGVDPGDQVRAAARLAAEAGVPCEAVEEDEAIWSLQREGQRSTEGTVVRVSATLSQLPEVLAAADRLGARAVGRAGLGLTWLRLEDRAPEAAAAAVAEPRRQLSPTACAVLDAPAAVRERVDPWGPAQPGAMALMRRVKERFDPAGTCNPGVLL